MHILYVHSDAPAIETLEAGLQLDINHPLDLNTMPP